MLIKTGDRGFDHPVSSEITSRSVYQGRRDMIRLMATGAAGATLAGWAGRQALAQTVQKPGKLAALAGGKSAVAGAMTMEKVTDYKDVTTYNNYYEFGVDKAEPAKNAHTLVTKPWSVAIEGLVKQPKSYTLEDLIKQQAGETRWYRLTPLWLLGVVLCFVPIVFRSKSPAEVGGSYYWVGYLAVSGLIAAGILLGRQRIAERLPSFEVLDDVMYKAIAVGFAFFTIATVLGALWAAEAWGGYWSWDPKETWALIVWLNYAAWLHMRLMKGLRGTVAAWWALVGLLVTSFAFLGVNMFLSGLHSYGTL